MKKRIKNVKPDLSNIPFVNTESMKSYWMDRLVNLDRVMNRGSKVVVLTIPHSIFCKIKYPYPRPDFCVMKVPTKTKAEDFAKYVLSERLQDVCFLHGVNRVDYEVFLFDGSETMSDYVLPFYNLLTREGDEDNLQKIMNQSLRGSVVYQLNLPYESDEDKFLERAPS